MQWQIQQVLIRELIWEGLLEVDTRPGKERDLVDIRPGKKQDLVDIRRQQVNKEAVVAQGRGQLAPNFVMRQRQSVRKHQ
jgi:hypothetical protein